MQKVMDTQFVPKVKETNVQMKKERGNMSTELSSSFDTNSETSQATKGDYVFSGPAPVVASSGFAWAKRLKEDTKSTQSISLSEISALESSFNFANDSFDLPKEKEEEATSKHLMLKHRRRYDSSDSFDTANIYPLYDAKATDETDALMTNPVRVSLTTNYHPSNARIHAHNSAKTTGRFILKLEVFLM